MQYLSALNNFVLAMHIPVPGHGRVILVGVHLPSTFIYALSFVMGQVLPCTRVRINYNRKI